MKKLSDNEIESIFASYNIIDPEGERKEGELPPFFRNLKPLESNKGNMKMIVRIIDKIENI